MSFVGSMPLLGLLLALSPHQSLAQSAAEPPPPQRAQARRGVGDHVRGEGQFFGVSVVPFDGEPSFGFGIGLGAGWDIVPVTLGFDLMSSYGATETERIYLEVAASSLPVDRTRQDRLFFVDLWLRIQPPYWRVRPYVEGLIGTKLLRSEYTLQFAGGDGTATLADNRDWTFSVAWGGGVDIALSSGGALALSLGFRRLHSADASFTRSVHTEGGDQLLSQRVPMGATLVTLGLTGHFDFAGSPPARPR